jgi:transcriptional regulator with XRE-family HTH domain
MEKINFAGKRPEMIREAIKLRMKELKMSQNELCTQLGIAQPNLSAFLNNKRTIPLEDIEKICSYLRLVLKSENTN